MEPTENIKRLLKKLNFDADPQVHQRILDDVLAAQAKTSNKGGTTILAVFHGLEARATLWRTIMKSRITKFAVAAGVMIALGILIYHQTGSIDGTSVVWADVQKQFQQFRPHSYKQTIKDKDAGEFTIKCFYRNLYGRREERSTGETYIFDMSKSPNECLILDEKQKVALKHIYLGTPMRKDFDMLSYAVSLENGGAESLGEKEVDGRRAVGFHNPDPINNFTFWVDPVSHLPIRVELLRNGSSYIWTAFEYVDDFDVSLFSTDVPDGYTYKGETRIQDYSYIEPKEVTAEDIQKNLNHTAYTIAKLSWMVKICTMEILDPLGSRAKVYVTGIQSDDENLIIIVQGEYYDGARMVWIPKQQLVLETSGGVKLYTHPNGSIYAQRFLESFAKIKPEFFDIKNLSEKRFTHMIVIPDGTIMSLSANKQMSDEKLKEFVEALTEIKP